jgi:hypothetical protein
MHFGEENTFKLMASAKRLGEAKFISVATKPIADYLYKKHDPYNFCVGSINQS